MEDFIVIYAGKLELDHSVRQEDPDDYCSTPYILHIIPVRTFLQASTKMKAEYGNMERQRRHLVLVTSSGAGANAQPASSAVNHGVSCSFIHSK